ncbi:hypothetical protein EGT07_21530 [Herbaspirillum sp. HC18]|nr:hypothetical protein EGT07_21530 [Herbaspirillum sp. HC18]
MDVAAKTGMPAITPSMQATMRTEAARTINMARASGSMSRAAAAAAGLDSFPHCTCISMEKVNFLMKNNDLHQESAV